MITNRKESDRRTTGEWSFIIDNDYSPLQLNTSYFSKEVVKW